MRRISYLLLGGALLLGISTPTLAADHATASVKPAVAIKKDLKASKTVAPKDVYACPMHADIKSDHADKCSKCGMLLEKKVAEKK